MNFVNILTSKIFIKKDNKMHNFIAIIFMNNFRKTY